MNQFDLLATRRFAPLFWVQFLGAFNDNVYRFALVIFVTFTLAERTGADTHALVPISLGVFIAPYLLFSSIAGQLADSFDKAWLIRRVKLTEIAVMALGAVGFWLEDVYLLMFALFLMGTQSTFFGPLKFGILPQHLRADELVGGNGLIQMGTYVAILLGATVGGLLASVDGFGPAPVVSCVLGLALVGWLLSWLIPPAPAQTRFPLRWNMVTATRDLLSYAASSTQILTFVLTISWFWFAGATFLSLVPAYGKDILGGDEQAVTVLNAAFTVGVGTGALLVERLSRRRIELGLVVVGALGVSLFALDFWLAGGSDRAEAPSLTLTTFLHDGGAVRAFVDLVGIGGFGALFIVPLYAALQARVPTERCARVIAALNVTNAGFMIVSAVFTAGLFGLGLRAHEIFAVTALLNIGCIVLAAAAVPEFRVRFVAVLRRRPPASNRLD